MKKHIPFTHFFTLLGTICLLLSSSVAFASNLETLIQDIAGKDEAKRVEARQLLPREGLNAVSPLLELMKHEDPVVWRTAKNVLADIGHRVGMPGSEADRRNYTNQLMQVVHSGAPDWTVKQAIRLLGIVAPEGYSLKPLRKLALTPKWRAETLGALEVMGTSESHKLLEDLSSIGSVEERVEVIELLRLVSGKVSLKLLRDSDPRIRVASMRALARTGTPKLIEPFQQAMIDVGETLHVEAIDAYLNLAETLSKNKAYRVRGLSMFHHILVTEKVTSIRGAALAGLGRYGDASVIPTIIRALHGDQARDLEAPALMALGNLHDQASYTAMLKVYPQVSPEMQLGLLGVFGRTRDPMFGGLLQSSAQSTNAATQAAALQALKQFELPSNINTAEASHPPKEE